MGAGRERVVDEENPAVGHVTCDPEATIARPVVVDSNLAAVEHRLAVHALAPVHQNLWPSYLEESGAAPLE